jgi:hypothetical protein
MCLWWGNKRVLRTKGIYTCWGGAHAGYNLMSYRYAFITGIGNFRSHKAKMLQPFQSHSLKHVLTCHIIPQDFPYPTQVAESKPAGFFPVAPVQYELVRTHNCQLWNISGPDGFSYLFFIDLSMPRTTTTRWTETSLTVTVVATLGKLAKVRVFLKWGTHIHLKPMAWSPYFLRCWKINDFIAKC